MRNSIHTFCKTIGRLKGAFFSVFPRSVKKILTRIVQQLISITSGKLSSLFYIVGYDMVKRMYRGEKKSVKLRKKFFNKNVLELDVTKKTQRILYLQKVYESYVANYIQKKLKDGDVFIDIGANVGFYTILAASLVGKDGKVFAFEPENSNYEALVKNTNLNHFTNIITIQKAVGVRDDTMTLNINPLNDGGGSLLELNTYSDDKETWTKEQILTRFPDTQLQQKIEVTSLDNFLSKGYANKTPAIIKIDIEGAELDALKGMRKLLEKNQAPDIIGEISMDGEKILNFMEPFGYRFYTLDSTGTPIPYTRSREVKVKALLFSKRLS